MSRNSMPSKTNRVLQRHTLSGKIHLGRLAVLLLLTLKAASLSLGCGPKEGELGGKCHPASSCGGNDWCDGSYVCNGETCQNSPPPESCSEVVSDECAPDEFAQVCTSARAQTASNCTRQADIAGGILYCCPRCWRTVVCDAPDSGFTCTSPYTPSERDPSLHCAVADEYIAPGGRGSRVDYCCGPNDGCFALQVDCSDGVHVYACTEDAGPPEDAGVCKRRVSDVWEQYCCVAPALPDASTDASDASDDAPDDAADE